MGTPTVLPFGGWPSPITPQIVAAAGVSLSHVEVDGSQIYWLEGRPQENGRSCIVRWDPEEGMTDAIPAWLNARSRVHEYGGGEYIAAEGDLFVSHFLDGSLFRIGNRLRTTSPLTTAGTVRFADFTLDQARHRLISVCEDHRSSPDPENLLITISLNEPHQIEPLVQGAGFYSSPRLSPDSTKLCWVSWNHPDMPWDSTQLFVATVLEHGGLSDPIRIAGDVRESALFPQWLPNGHLLFASDRSGWWNLYCWNGHDVRPITDEQAEFAVPPWILGCRPFIPLSNEQAVAIMTTGDGQALVIVDLASGAIRKVSTPFTAFAPWLAAYRGRIVCIVSHAQAAPAVVLIDPLTGVHEVLHRSSTLELSPSVLARPEHMTYEAPGGETVHAFYYPPTNGAYRGPDGAAPPLRVVCHGGPTSATTTALNLGNQLWTSRGYAVLDVNYRGSSGYGRSYREALYGTWGKADVDDCCAGADALAQTGRVDASRLIIAGGSAGGFTALAALTFRETFTAGASYYGIADLELLLKDMHKFESRYLERLIGPYPAAQALFQERSPIYHADQLTRPVILFQGLDDKVVPPNQAEQLVEHLRARRIPHVYVTFPGEGHGFQKAENVRRALACELSFFSQILQIPLSESIEHIPVTFLPPR
ncbi:MAG: prolyl oligopeptidase family serine peptidase [Chloroflexi bacterium]|nr:prolyl oligopeptidase family serine peptidase [Chloroflexota bacterium]